ncbi:amidase [Streptomyces sp. NBC_01465]|uniref:amidase n=1 Tax=Streptomyces sp. NBC_01465 TaxID=2903878 RepID=UPI002E339F91|nr:amidase [Streptomyces sp. NBC_01465]
MDSDIQAFVPEPDRETRLRSETAALAARWPDPANRPPLYGIPVGIKDIIHVDGLPTRAGSSLPPAALAGPQATVVTRLREAGALIAGKTVTAEFAVLAPGPTHNPHNPAHTPGGSSSGSAAGVAAGLFPLSVGTQTVGSMIRPGAYCGVVAFKPTYDRIPTDGVIANAPSFDTLGLYAQDVAGLLPAASVVCDDWTPRDPDDLPVLGIPTGPYLDRAEPEALKSFTATAEHLERAGFTVRRIPVMQDFDRTVSQLFTMNRYELARTHAAWFAEYAKLYRRETRQAIREGHAITHADYVEACAAREAFRTRMAEAMAPIDLWITPAATGPAPKGLTTTGSSIMCLPWSNIGLPSLTIPSGRAPNGLPLGLQCVAAPHQDEQLLDWSAWIEAALV